MERVRSIFRRNSERVQDPEPWVPYYNPNQPNGIVQEQPLHDQSHPEHHHPQPQPPPSHHQPQPTHHQPQPPSHHQPAPTHHHQQHHRQHPPHPGDGTGGPLPSTSATQSGTLQIDLHNDSNSSNVYAYITGQAINHGNALFLLSADGQTPYYPGSPSSTNQRVQQNISIHLGSPGNVVHCIIPFIAGGRIWFSVGAPLQFGINPGPGLVEPSIFNQSDPNINTNFGFAEFTFNNSELFANISYVDFVGLPISMTLEEIGGHIQHVSGMPPNGLQTIANGLRQQTARDGQRWSSLIVNRRDGSLLRILSPNSGMLLNPSWFSGYWANYVNQVYGKFANQQLTIDTQAGYGNVRGRSTGGGINFGAGGNFQKPTSGDIFSCSSGPFATGGNGEANAIIPRLAAAFNRSTLLLTDNEPDGVGPKQYYTNPTTNHYARVVHAANLDHHGYAFPYDDVTPDNGVPQEGSVVSGSVGRLVVSVGGNNAHA